MILTPRDITGELNVLYSFGATPGDSTGWKSLDELYTIKPGQVTVVTGWPGSGKSEWLDCLLVNLAKFEWRIACYSPENWPVAEHVSKVIEKWIGKPFSVGPTDRMGYDEVLAATEAIDDRMSFMKPIEDDSLGIRAILEQAEEWHDRFDAETGIKRGLVIDPWNEVDHMRPRELTETEYISRVLSFIRNWARRTHCHVWIVAHPAKQAREAGKLPVPRPDMIAGSQNWWNKADCCVTVWRNYEDDNALVEIHVQKVRFKRVGRIGVIGLRYDRSTGRYFEPARDANGREVYYSMGR